MLTAIFGNKVLEQILYYLVINSDGYPRGIAAKLGVAVYSVQMQLKRLERDRIVLSRQVGRTRVYRISPVWPLKDELTALVEGAIKFQGRKEMNIKYSERRRPRRPGKPI